MGSFLAGSMLPDKLRVMVYFYTSSFKAIPFSLVQFLTRL